MVPGVEELTGGDPELEVLENARRKARAIVGRGKGACGRAHGVRSRAARLAGHERLVIACDTDVVLDGKALGKPDDEAGAGVSGPDVGAGHEVLSGLVVLAGGEERSGLERTIVVFKELDEAAKERYVRFGEWRGRSGGYAIQTLGSTLVERVEGSISNVIGLPVGLLAELAPELFPAGLSRAGASASSRCSSKMSVISRVEVGAATLLDQLRSLIHRHRRPVAAVAQQGVEDVGDGDDPAHQGNVSVGQPTRVAGAVEALVMGERDRRGHPQQLAVGVGEDLVADGRVALHLGSRSSAVSGPALWRISSGVAILPMSCIGAAARRSRTCSWSRPICSPRKAAIEAIR